MEEQEQPLSEDMLFRIMKVAEILAKSSDFDPRSIKQSSIQNSDTSKMNGVSAISSKKTRS